jgi:hypothetical protein
MRFGVRVASKESPATGSTYLNGHSATNLAEHENGG